MLSLFSFILYPHHTFCDLIGFISIYYIYYYKSRNLLISRRVSVTDKFF